MAYMVPCVHPAYILHDGKPIVDYIRLDLAKALRLGMGGEPQHKEQFCICLPSVPGGHQLAIYNAIQWIRSWRAKRVITAVDVEASSLEFWNLKLYSLALSGLDGHNVGIAYTTGDLYTLPSGDYNALDQEVRGLLADPMVPKAYQNCPYDQGVLMRKGYTLQGYVIDTLGLSHAMQPDVPHDLGTLGHAFLDVDPWKLSHDGRKKAFETNVPELLLYNAKDAIRTACLVDPLVREILSRGMNYDFINAQMSYSEIAVEMEMAGIPVNKEKRLVMGRALLVEVNGLLHDMREMLGQPDFNPNSPTHKIDALFKHYALKPVNKTPTGLPGTGREDLLDYLEHPFVAKFVKHAELSKAYASWYGTKGVDGCKKDGSFTRNIFDDNCLHSKWSAYGQTAPRMTSSPNCLDAETEVLTSNGWVFMPEAVEHWTELLFAQYNPSREEAAFTKATGAIKTKPRRMLELESQQASVCGTRDHRMLLREYNPTQHESTWQVLSLEDLPRHLRFVHAAEFKFGKEHVGDTLMRLVVACQANGSWSREEITFDFKHERKYVRLRALLDAVGAEYSHRSRPEVPKHKYQIRIFKSPITRTILGYIGHELEWGSWLLDITKADAETFLDEIPCWDGSIKGRRAFYYSIKKTNTSWVQIVSTLLGRRATELDAGTCYRVSISDVKAFSSARTQPTQLTYKKNSYCISVPTGFIITRRHGKVIIIGNCQNITLAHREFFEAPDGWAFVGADKDQLELRVSACEAGEEELLEEMRKPNGDPHTMAAIRIFGDDFLNQSKKDQKLMRDGLKNTTYCGLYEGSLKTVHTTIRKNKYISAELRGALTMEFVSKMHKGYFGRYTKIFEENKRVYEHACKHGYTEVEPYGRRRCWQLQPPNYNEVVNWRVQCRGVEHVNICVQRMRERFRHQGLRTAKIIQHGHDSVATMCQEKDAELVKRITNEEFGNDVIYGPAGPVNLSAKATIGKTLKSVK